MDVVVRRIVIFGLVLATAFATDAVSGLQTMESLRNRVKGVFYHAYENYLQHAFPLDELRPLTCDGQDTWGSFSLTLIDALDTLLVLGNTSEFRRVSRLLQNTIDFTQDVNVSVFETNIRVVGGLLSAHMLSKMAGIDLEPGWPCTGPLLRLAEDAARKLLPAFHTKTGMPYGTVNLLHGVHATETPVTCTAGVGTFILEFATLSRLTGDPAFEEAARRALRALWESRSDIGLVGNHINVNNSHWVAEDAGIGAGVDSYFEYLIKGAILLQEPKYMEMFQEFVQVIEKYMKHDDWYMWVHMSKGTVSMPVFQSLEAFWPGLQSLVGDIDSAMKTLHNYHQVWQKYGGLPEFYNIPHSMPVDKREGYPLRPELVESAMYLYRATKDPFLLHLGQDVLEAIEKISSVSCGHATIKDVHDHKLDNRMESFFLAETTKYLYLLFDPENFLHNTGTHWDSISTPFGPCILNAGGYVFNTEAHPIDPAALYCCNRFKEEQMQVHTQFEDVRLRVKSYERTPSSTGTDNKSNMLDSREGKTNRKPKIPVMSAPSQPYTSRLSIMGQMFLHQDV